MVAVLRRLATYRGQAPAQSLLGMGSFCASVTLYIDPLEQMFEKQRNST